MNLWAFLITFVIAVTISAVGMALSRGQERFSRGLRIGFLPLSFALALLAGWLSVEQPREASVIPRQTADDEYIGSTSCNECHQKQHGAWHRSFHRTMTQVASPQSIVGDFDAEVSCYDQPAKFERRGDEFWVRFPNPEREAELFDKGELITDRDKHMVERKVVLVTGSHNYQLYWVKSELRNGLTQVPWVWAIQQQRWLPYIYTTLESDQEENHSIQPQQVWNENCIRCHSVAGKPLLDPDSQRFASEVAEFGISCEACHGPGRKHVEFRRLAARENGAGSAHDPILNPAKRSHQVASQVCGQCHSAFMVANEEQFNDKGVGYRPGAAFARTHTLLRAGESYGDEMLEAYVRVSHWPNGTNRVGGDEYNSMILSPCYVRGQMSCLSCHSMHGYESTTYQLKPKMDGNEGCLQCHGEKRDQIAEHTHHPVGSAGSKCYNCHQPYTSFALLKGIRSHRVDVPNVALSAEKGGQPNACNLCHLDKSLGWTAKHLEEWFGVEKPALTTEQEKLAASVSSLLQGDAAQRVITAWHMGWPEARKASGDGWQAPLLAQLLDDPYAVVRYVGEEALRTQPGFAEFPYDYVARRPRLTEAKQRAIEIWMKGSADSRRSEPETLLIDRQRGLLQDRVDALLNVRDHTKIWIPE